MRQSFSKGILPILLLSSCTKDLDKNFFEKTVDHYYVEAGIDHFKERTKAKWVSTQIRRNKLNKITLTFDDGPGPYTHELLDILEDWNLRHPENKVVATFFVLGKNLSPYQDVARRALQLGHHIASHDWDHTDNNLEDEKTFKEGLKKSLKAIKEIYDLEGMTFHHGLFRFPYGNYGQHESYHHFDSLLNVGTSIFGENCINYAFWDLDTSDWVNTISSKQIAQNLYAFLPASQDKTFYDRSKDQEGKWEIRSREITTQELGGGVALLHDVHHRSVKAVALFLNMVELHNLNVQSENETIYFSDILEIEEYKIKSNCEDKVIQEWP